MRRSLSPSIKRFKLNNERISRSYSAEICNKVIQGKRTIYSAIVQDFSLTYNGDTAEGFLNYKWNVQKRFFLNERYNIIKDLNKAQKIALTVASINDNLNLQVSKDFSLIKVTNTSEVRNKWEIIKKDLLKEFPDLLKMTEDFEWQLQEENIQSIFLNDNFFNCFFPNLFQIELEEKNPSIRNYTLSDAVGKLNLPIIEERVIAKRNLALNEVFITKKAKLDTSNKKFPMAKLNAFLGSLPTNAGEQHPLKFSYDGTYKINTKQGLITEGTLMHQLDIKDLYQKTTTITFNLQQDEQ